MWISPGEKSPKNDFSRGEISKLRMPPQGNLNLCASCVEGPRQPAFRPSRVAVPISPREKFDMFEFLPGRNRPKVIFPGKHPNILHFSRA